MAGGPFGIAEVQQSIRVAVGDHLLDEEEVTAGLPLVPQLLSAAAPEPRGMGFQGFLICLLYTSPSPRDRG